MELIIKKVNNHWEVFDGQNWWKYNSKIDALQEAILNIDPKAEYIEIRTEELK